MVNIGEMTDNYLSCLFLYTLTVLLCVADAFVKSHNSPSVSSDIPITNPEDKHNLGPTLKILYWWVQVKCH
jgi:hypothetical protein